MGITHQVERGFAPVRHQENFRAEFMEQSCGKALRGDPPHPASGVLFQCLVDVVIKPVMDPRIPQPTKRILIILPPRFLLVFRSRAWFNPVFFTSSSGVPCTSGPTATG